MSTGTDISALYREFTDALTEVLAESAGSPARAALQMADIARRLMRGGELHQEAGAW